jgi:hypothetical protein
MSPILSQVWVFVRELDAGEAVECDVEWSQQCLYIKTYCTRLFLSKPVALDENHMCLWSISIRAYGAI